MGKQNIDLTRKTPVFHLRTFEGGYQNGANLLELHTVWTVGDLEYIFGIEAIKEIASDYVSLNGS